jgi:hypothetical protein
LESERSEISERGAGKRRSKDEHGRRATARVSLVRSNEKTVSHEKLITHEKKTRAA